MDLPPGSTPDFFCCVLYWVFGRGRFFPEVFHPFGWFPLTFFASLPFPFHTPGEWVVLPDAEVRSGGGGVKIKRRVPPSDVEAGEGCLDVAGTGGCASSVYSFGVQLLLHFPYMASPNHDIQHSLSSSGASMAPGCNRHANLLCHSKLTLCHALYPPIKAC